MFNTTKLFARKKGSFRFLDLPKEIRLMVYDRLPRAIKHTHMLLDMHMDQITLVRPYMELTILRACKTVYEEAHSLVERSIAQFILDKPPRGIGGTASAQPSLAFGVLTRLSLVQFHELDRGGNFLEPDVLFQRFMHRYHQPANVLSIFYIMADWLLNKSIAHVDIIKYINVSAVQLLRQSTTQLGQRAPKFRLEYAHRCEVIHRSGPANTARNEIQLIDSLSPTSLKDEGVYIALVAQYLWPHGLIGITPEVFSFAGLYFQVPSTVRHRFFKLRVAIQADRILKRLWDEEQKRLQFNNWQSFALRQRQNMPNTVGVYAEGLMSFKHWLDNWKPTILTYSLAMENHGA